MDARRIIRLIPLLGLLLLAGCTSREDAQRAALEDYLWPLLENAKDPSCYQLCHTDADQWYLFAWDDPEAVAAGSPMSCYGDAYPLSCPPDETLNQPCEDFTIDVTAETGETGILIPEVVTKLRYTITNHGKNRITLSAIRWLDVQLEGEWYRLWFKGVSQVKCKDRIEPGGTLTDTRMARLGNKRLALPAGHYRWCFLITIGPEGARVKIPAAVEFDIPEAE